MLLLNHVYIYQYYVAYQIFKWYLSKHVHVLGVSFSNHWWGIPHFFFLKYVLFVKIAKYKRIIFIYCFQNDSDTFGKLQANNTIKKWIYWGYTDQKALYRIHYRFYCAPYVQFLHPINWFHRSNDDKIVL